MPETDAQTKRVQDALLIIEREVESVEHEADEYGGWPGEDIDSKMAADLGMRLAAIAWACAIGGREYAEGGEQPW